jgi:periplasmic protein CpxP/Spy
MKRQFIRFATAAALAAGLALAQTPAPQAGQARPPAEMRAAVRHRMMQNLNLTDAQKQQAKAIFQQAKADSQPIRDQLKQNREAFSSAVKGNNVSQIQSLSAQQGNLRGHLTAIHGEAMAKFYNLLTPDQRAKADQMQQRIRQRIEQRFQQRRNGNNG